MIVKMTVQISGLRDGIPWPAIGETIEVSDHEGLALVVGGVAEKVDFTEMASFIPPEAAMVDRPQPRRPGRPRKEVFPPKEA